MYESCHHQEKHHHEVRKAKFEKKTRKRKTPIFNEEKNSTTTRRNTITEWAGVGVSGKLVSEKTKMFEKEKIENGTVSTDRLRKVNENDSSSSSISSCSISAIISDRLAASKSNSVKNYIQTGQGSIQFRK